MKQKRESGGFFLCVGINLLMHSWWLAVGLLLLGLHYWAGWPLWLNWAAGPVVQPQQQKPDGQPPGLHQQVDSEAEEKASALTFLLHCFSLPAGTAPD